MMTVSAQVIEFSSSCNAHRWKLHTSHWRELETRVAVLDGGHAQSAKLLGGRPFAEGSPRVYPADTSDI